MTHDPDALEFVRLTGHSLVLDQIAADPRYLAVVRAALPALRAGAGTPPTAAAAAAPGRCPYLDSCRCHGPVPVCLHTLHGPAYGEPADERGSIVYRVTPAACAACPLTTTRDHQPTTGNPMSQFSTTVGSALTFKLGATDKDGHPGATLAAPAAVTSSDPSVATAAPAEVGVGGTVTVTGLKPGVATIKAVSGTLAAEVDVTVTSGPAVAISLDPVTA